MNPSSQLARHLHDVFFGENWTSVNLKQTLADITWEQANQKTGSLNTIIKLVYHIHYYVHHVLAVFKGGPLDAHDKFSFDHPPIKSEDDWSAFLDTVWKEAEELSQLVAKLPEEKWTEPFQEEKYGNHFRNILGIIEHTHYHLGQIVIIRKII
jgi:uncharacterized damage-inducible protein DinB